MARHFNDVVLQTERLTIYRYQPDDLDNFFRLNGDDEIMKYIRPAKSYEESKRFLSEIIDAYSASPGRGRWGMNSTSDDRFIGSLAIIPVENMDCLQIGYALLKENWGNGYASEAVKGGTRYAFDQLKLTSLAGITFPENVASQKVLIKNGFEFSETFREAGRELYLYLRRTDA